MALALPFAGCAAPASDARADWRVFEVRVQVSMVGARGPVRAWLPLPLARRNLAGKCADLNALFVGLARASGIPARDLYGLRVAPSTRFTSLGRSGGDVTSAQHCRAEVHLREFAFNDAHDVVLPGSAGSPLPFLM